MKYAIVGYGNLGKSLEKLICEGKSDELTCIYSRRRITHPLARPMKRLAADRDWDVALIALGSYLDVQQLCHLYSHHNTVDCFDISEQASSYKRLLEQGKPQDKLSIVGAGWDPGLLDIVRASLGEGCVTLWGRGISLGHSNALRAVDGVLDAVQITQPIDNAHLLTQDGQHHSLHKRICYVNALECDRETVKERILNINHYFEGQAVEIIFCSAQEVKRQKESTQHKGRVLCFDRYCTAQFCLEMTSNNDCTASIMLRYARALPRLLAKGYSGAVGVLDIPLGYLAYSSNG